MHGEEKSDPAIVAEKPANGPDESLELVEPRAGAEGNTSQQRTYRTQDRASVSQGLERVRQVARRKKNERFTTLLHHITHGLEEAFFGLKRNAAAGVDGVTWEDYAQGLEQNLADLHDRIHRGSYRAQPARRRFIPKGDGRMRPLGIAALEDKIVQRATVRVLNAIYEEDFLGFSYGFRPKRSQHDALDALIVAISTKRVNYILDADIQSFFDTISQDWLMRFLDHRIGDPRVHRLIRKWLKAGVLEEGEVLTSDQGTGQGSVASPLLANVYLHHVFDLWAQEWRRTNAAGDVILVRYADDIVCGFEHEAEARRFLDDLRARFETYGLKIHPEKTRLIEFGRHAAEDRHARGLGKPETFDFLGFTLICGKTRRGKFQVKRRTRADRKRAKLAALKDTLMKDRHRPIPEQGEWLRKVVRGFFRYHAVPTNYAALASFRHHLIRIWQKALQRRSQKDRTRWGRMTALADHWIPKPKILHPWPDKRFAVNHPRWEPDAGNPPVRFCAGGAR